VTSTPHPSDPVSGNEKLGAAAEYLATQVASRKADAILPALGAKVARLAGALRPVVRSMVRVALGAVCGVFGKADTGGTAVEDER
jgi:hypothetical protein